MAETLDDVVVRTVGLTKVFHGFWFWREQVTAVRELDLAVRKGEVYGLLGPNGSGKSTTLKMLLGLMFPTRGRVVVFGKGPGDVRTKGRIGFLPEESYLYPFLDAHETLDYYGRLFHQHRRERRRRIDMLLDMVGLTGSAYRRIGEYSKGMQRRIGMAQALINDPDLLILDEPTSGMDPLAARQFKDLINELSRRGKTIILSSHLLADMEDVCDRVGILYAGQLREEGPLSSLLSRQSLTQIIADRLDDQTVARVRRLLAEEDKQVHAVESPRDRLEALFLRIVHEASASRQRGGAAVDTGEVAEFLRAEGPAAGRKVIERLMAAPSPPPPAGGAGKPAGPFGPKPPAAPAIIEQLTSPAKPAEAAKGPAPPAPAPARQAGPKADADRGVIDSLIQGDDPQEKNSPDA